MENEESYIIEEVEYMECSNDEMESNDEITIEVEDEPRPCTSKSIEQNVVNRNTNQIGPEQEGNLIKKLINGELTFSEYNREMGDDVADDVVADDDVDDDNGENESDDNLVKKVEKEKEIPKKKLFVNSLVSQNFEDELDQSRKDAMRGILKGRDQLRDGRHRRRCVLPAALQGLMGEANLCYARGQTDLAEKVCLEIIRQVPLAPEPFLTLAQIHDTNPEKYLQFSLIAAHLNPADSEQWTRVAQFCLEQGNIKQAINCYTKAIKFNPKDIDLRLKRIELLETINEEKIVFRCWVSLLFVIPAEQADFLMQTAKMVAERFIKESNYTKALEAMSFAYRKAPQLFQSEDLNQLFELLIANNEYKKVLDILSTQIDLQIVYNETNMGSPTMDTIVNSIRIPKLMILDFRTKLIVSLVHLKAFHLMDYLLENVFTHINVEDAGDCYLDVAEALMKEEKYREAIRLLVPLVESKNYSLAAVWLRHANCYRAIGEYDQAIHSYTQVVALAPQHFDARLTLSALLKQQGRDCEALQALEQDLDRDLIDPCVLYERCFMLKETGNIDQYLNIAMLLISRHCIRIRNPYEMFVMTHTSKYSNKLQLIRENRKARKEPIEDYDGPEFVPSLENQPTVDEEFNLLRNVLKTAYEMKNYGIMQKIAITALSSKRFTQQHNKEIYFYSLLSTIFNRDANFSYILIKDYVVKYLKSHRIWNLFNVILQFTECSNRYSRFLSRLFTRAESEIEEWPKILRANYCFASATYKYAVNDYMQIFKVTNSPMVALMIGITYICIAQQKYTTKKQTLISQAISFLNKYGTLREPEAMHEVQYNLGRLHHQFGMYHIAIYHYKKVLQISNEFIEAYPDYLDLKREAAYNLHLIYRKSGNTELARKYLNDFIIV